MPSQPPNKTGLFGSEPERIAFQASLLNRVRSAVLATDQRGCIVYMNSAAEDLFALPWQQAEGRYLTDLTLWPDPLAEPLMPAASRHERCEREVIARRTDGTTFPALCTTSISPSPEGQGYSEVHMVHDLTEIKTMQSALLHHETLVSLGRMSASLVHEISQPMNVIRLTAEGSLLKLSKAASPSDALAELQSGFQIIAEQAARLFETVEFMQTFSHQSEGHLQAPAPAPAEGLGCFDLARSLRESASVLYLGFQNAAVALTMELPKTPCLARGHARQVEQVLINLLNNGLYAAAERGEHGEVCLSLSSTPTQWEIRIDDNGHGIAPEIRDKIFAPFFTTKPHGQGSGLGLSISREILRATGGSLSYQPSEHGGACFIVTIPHAAPPPVTPDKGAEARPLAAYQAKTPGHIMIVDDDAPTRHSLSQALESLGYQTSEASGGYEALRFLAEQASHHLAPVDAIITDLRMPDGNGFQLLEALALDYPQVFTIVVTGQSRRDREAFQALENNCDILLPKPVSLHDLAETLEALFEGAATTTDDDVR